MCSGNVFFFSVVVVKMSYMIFIVTCKLRKFGKNKLQILKAANPSIFEHLDLGEIICHIQEKSGQLNVLSTSMVLLKGIKWVAE